MFRVCMHVPICIIYGIVVVYMSYVLCFIYLYLCLCPCMYIELLCSSPTEESLNDTPDNSSSSTSSSSSTGNTRRGKKAALCELCSSVISKCCGRVAEQFQHYCQENTMQLLLIIDITLLCLNLICIVQGIPLCICVSVYLTINLIYTLYSYTYIPHNILTS